MNKLYNKNGCTNIKYIGVINKLFVGKTPINWVGVISIGDQKYVPQGSGVYHDYHPMDETTGEVKWQETYKVSAKEHEELTKQYRKFIA